MIYWMRRGAGLLHCDGVVVKVTTIGAMIIDRLLASPGRAISCERLVDAVYGGARLPEDPKAVVQVTICKLRQKGVPIRSRGRGSVDGYWFDCDDVGFKRGDRYRIDGCPGVFTVKRVIDAPVIVFENADLGMEAMKPADDPVLQTLRRSV